MFEEAEATHHTAQLKRVYMNNDELYVRLLIGYLLYGSPGQLLILAWGRRLSPLCLSRARFPARGSALGIAKNSFASMQKVCLVILFS